MVDEGKKPEDIMPLYRQIHLEYRTEILGARDRIMRKISSPESEFALGEFLELVRGGLVYRVDKMEYESGFYKQPR
jgi:hypothetical protein